MDEFTYSNIFDTKGIEYLIIIAFLFLIIPFWLTLNKPLMIKEKIGLALSTLSENILRIPQGLFYSKNHTWTHLEMSGNATIGVDDLLLHLTGRVAMINLKVPGESVAKGECIALLSQNGKQLKITSPLSGEIQNVNHSLSEKTGLINSDPYENGWIYKIKPDNWKDETSTCLFASQAIAWSKEELSRFKDFIAISLEKYAPETAKVVLQEGGELIDHPMVELPKELWNDFQAQFLNKLD